MEGTGWKHVPGMQGRAENESWGMHGHPRGTRHPPPPPPTTPSCRATVALHPASLELSVSYNPETLGFSPGAGNWLRAELVWAGTQVAVLQARASHCTPMQSLPIPRQNTQHWAATHHRDSAARMALGALASCLGNCSGLVHGGPGGHREA